jgi:hypothetical protein
MGRWCAEAVVCLFVDVPQQVSVGMPKLHSRDSRVMLLKGDGCDTLKRSCSYRNDRKLKECDHYHNHATSPEIVMSAVPSLVKLP